MSIGQRVDHVALRLRDVGDDLGEAEEDVVQAYDQPVDRGVAGEGE